MSVEQERLSSVGWSPPWIRHEHMARYLFARDLADKRVVVDCACGDGTSSRLLAERATHVWAFDIAPEAVERARASNGVPNIEYAVADAAALPLEEGSADAYVSLETIEHIVDEVAFLREVVRVLEKKNGFLVCSTPDRDIYSPGNAPEDKPWNTFHVREYTAFEFAALLGRFFESVELFGQNPKSPLMTRLKQRAGVLLPGHLVVRINQASKLTRFIRDRIDNHRVRPVEQKKRYEYVVAVCRRPRVG